MNVGVLRGGVGHEYDVSLKTGGEVLRHLPPHYKKRDLLVTKDGIWHLDGLPVHPEELKRRVDVVFNALHGRYGEDGHVQRFLDTLAIPYTGPKNFAAAVTFNKVTTKDILTRAGFKVPRGVVVNLEEPIATQAQMVFQKFCPPWIVKPADSGSSVGVALARNIPELITAINACFEYTNTVLVEEFVRGREAICGVIEDYRNEQHYVLLPVEVQKPHLSVFAYDHKYAEEAPLVCPATFSQTEKKALEAAAREVYQILDLRHYATIDCIVAPSGVFVLEANSLPGLTPSSAFTRALEAIGSSQSDFLDHVITRARY